MKFTLLGHSSYIASYLFSYLKSNNHDVQMLPREFHADSLMDLGHVIYCIGLTANFRNKPLSTVDAHCFVLHSILKEATFDSLTYLSSTRIYKYLENTEESQLLKINPQNIDDIYNVSKIMGEAMCLSFTDKPIRVVRLSNVYGKTFNSPNYLDSLVRYVLSNEPIRTQTRVESQKDYIYIDDVVEQLFKIATRGTKKIYNLASGYNTKSGDILDFLSTYYHLPIQNENSNLFSFPTMNIENIITEFGFKPRSFFRTLKQDIKQIRGQ